MLTRLIEKADYKYRRYAGLVRNIRNWPAYLLWKTSGAAGTFAFDVRGLGRLELGGRELGPFRENLLNRVYFDALPPEARRLIPRQRPVVVDIGGNAGYFALSVFLTHADAKVVSFEPHPYCVKLLEGYAARFSRFDWTIDPTALGDRDGPTVLHARVEDGFSTTSGTERDVRNLVTIPVACQTLRRALDAHTLDVVHLAKIDCEGGEYAILYGADAATLSKISVLCIETHASDRPNYNHGALDEYLTSRGFATAHEYSDGETQMLYAYRV